MDPSPFAKFCKDYIFRILNKRAKDRLLDVCCGNGRDSLYFSKNQFDVYSFDKVNVSNTQIKFKQIDLKDKPYKFTYIGSQFNYIYCRFVLHAVTEDIEDHILINSNRCLYNQGYLFIEARSDKGVIPDHIAKHYRRLINIDELKQKLTNLSFEIVFQYEGEYLSVYNNENPILIRIIAQKKDPIKVKSGLNFNEYLGYCGKINNEDSKYLLLKTKMILDSYNIPFILIFGTLLGAYRDKKFISYDKDMDIALFTENTDKVVNIIRGGYFKIYGIEYIRDALYKNLLSLVYKNDYIDFSFWHKREDGYWYGDRRIDLWQIDNGLTEIEFLGQKFNTVNNIEALLEKCYGNTWETKIENYPANEKF